MVKDVARTNDYILLIIIAVVIILLVATSDGARSRCRVVQQNFEQTIEKQIERNKDTLLNFKDEHYSASVFVI